MHFFPAYAGVIPTARGCRRAAPTFPRPCGGDPSPATRTRNTSDFSPPCGVIPLKNVSSNRNRNIFPHRLLKKAGIPVVVLTQDYEDGISIIYDDYHAGKTIGEYIGKKGHQKVGYIGVYETDQAVGIERRNGVLDGLKEYGITPVTGKSDYSFIGGQTVTRELLERESDLDAIICATDRLAFGAYKILHEHKKRIPEEVSVAAFGGYDESTLLTPELTTLKFDSYGMGYLGAETILKMITGEPVSKKQIVGYEFIEGGSVRS